MADRTQRHPTATVVAARLRTLASAGLVAGAAALAVATGAYADAPGASAGSGAGAQNASVSTRPHANDKRSVAVSREYLIKAAILFNFAKFASWPQTAFTSAEAPLRICVLGDDPFGPALDTLSGKRVRNRPMETIRLGDLDRAADCHIMYVSSSEEPRLAAILAHVAELPILTVAEMGRFANSGGIIALKEVDNRSRIEINLGAAKQAGVILSSKLLRLADTVSTQAARQPVK